MPPKRRQSTAASSAALNGVGQRDNKKPRLSCINSISPVAETAASSRPQRTSRASIADEESLPSTSLKSKKNSAGGANARNTKDEKGSSIPSRLISSLTSVYFSSFWARERQVFQDGHMSAAAGSSALASKSSSRNKKLAARERRRGSETISAVAAHGMTTESKANKSPDSDQNDDKGEDDGISYWLMKAEPESRFEKGVDVKFSIDDLREAKEPEPWDARNNMRAMKKGDLAFFYHSNCKVPGIAGIMEIVREHSVDESAFDPAHPYYDEKSSRENPKWEVVHVEFRRKFKDLITLAELKSYAKPGGPLENMQMTKQSRLSVSVVSRNEWKFIMSLVGEE
ncbi:hypothetical protein PABG_00663 [Paracoccidioides brasiliensis Pb03]|nr:hypothetical protein PABG_00663 [Paracoccidioides brasiliensis Pb03]